MKDETKPTRGKVAIGAAILGLAAGVLGALMWGLGMMAIGVQPAPMNLIGAFGFVTIGFITTAIIGCEFTFYR